MQNLKPKNKEKLLALLGVIYVIFTIIRRGSQDPKIIAFSRIIVPFECILLIYLLITSLMKTQSRVFRIGYFLLIILFVIIFIKTIPMFLDAIPILFYGTFKT